MGQPAQGFSPWKLSGWGRLVVRMPALTWNQSAVLLQTKHSQVPVVHGYLTVLMRPVLSCRTCCLGGSSDLLSWTCLRPLAGFCFSYSISPCSTLYPCAHSPAHLLSPLLAGVWPWPRCMRRLGCGMNEWTKRGRNE